MATLDFESGTWDVINSYFANNKGHQLVKHQLESFNDFILRKLDQIIDGFNPIEIQHQYIPEISKFKYGMIINIRNPILNKPIICEKDGSTKTMTPNDARQRNFTYSSNLTVDIEIVAKSLSEDGSYMDDTKELKNVLLGKIPIMVKSNYCILNNKFALVNGHECKYDYGGYFIINGNEKVVISQDRISENKTYVFVNNKISTYSHIAEIRSVQENKLGVPKITTLKLSAKANQFGRYIRVNIHHIKNDIPIFILFKALGLNNDKEILEYITYNLDNPLNSIIAHELIGSIEEANNIQCPKDALEYLSKYLNITGYPKEVLNNKTQRIQIVRNVLCTEFLPHVGKEFHKKALYLGYMVNKLLKCFLELKEFDDRDSYINKKIDTPGVLMANLFRQYYGKVVKDMKNMIQKEINVGGWKATNKFSNVINKVNIYKILKSTIIDSGMRYALATGNWGIKNNKNKQGVAQVLNRMTYSATISHMRRINTPIEKSGKLVQPRKLHPTQWGIICPSECFDPNTPILMWDGQIKKAKDIKIGDELIDDTGNAVKVKSTCSGEKMMYEIIPDKKNFMSHTVTDNHILTLKVRNYRQIKTDGGKKVYKYFDKKDLKFKSKYFDNELDLGVFKLSIDDDDVIDITIEQYLSLPENIQKNLYLFKSDGINWDYKEVALDPYILGMWLGDGLSSGFGFATADKELLDKWIEWGEKNDGTIKHHERYAYGISSTINNTQPGISCNKTEEAPLKKLLRKYNLVKNKHIPMDYLTNDRKTRLKVLAGIVDTDGSVRGNGHEIRICQGEKNYQIIYDTEFLARSLGFSCHVSEGMCTYSVNGEKRQRPYKELFITGKNLYEIPTVLPRKKLNKLSDVAEKRSPSTLQSSFRLVKKDVQPFVGWQLHGNGRFLLGDMTVSHNTPEGSSVGLVKNMSMICSITISSNSMNVREIVKDHGTELFNGQNIDMFHNNTKVIINGDIIGIHRDPLTFYKKLKEEKLSGTINIYTSIVWNIKENEISICTEGGRCVRPLYIVNDGNINLTPQLIDDLKSGNLTWKDMIINQRVIEYMDVEETNTAMIAMNYQDLFKGNKGSLLPIKYTHLEIHPSLILGVLASTIPFSDHNQAPRNTYQSAQCKQAIGIYALNYRHRYDTLGHILHYPQRPIVKTRVASILNTDHMPNGINAIVAIACYTGFNQEDSVVLNRSACDRGLFVSTYFRTYKEQNNKNHSNGEEEFFTKPEVKALKSYNYDKLNQDGFVPENTYVEGGDIIIGKCMPNKIGNIINYKDNSIGFKNNDQGFIDSNAYGDKKFCNTNGDGYTFAKVRIRSDRIPTIGDKFSSRSGQKGTCGILYTQEDMPFTKDGIVPDLIMNPHAIPSRMTIGQLIECIMGKACLELGTYGDSTPFTNITVEEIADLLEACGMERYGNEIMYNSRTGAQIDTLIFMGPTYYQRLKHMTVDKIHCYSSDTEILTDQGWISFQALKDEKVATLLDDKLVYQKPIEVQQYDYEGPMYLMDTDKINIMVTPNHRMYVDGQMKEAEEIFNVSCKWKKNVEDYIPDSYPDEFIVENDKITKFKLYDKLYDMEYWLTYFGIWMTDIKTAFIWEDMSLIRDYTMKYKNNYMPNWVFKLPKDMCQMLLNAMCLGKQSYFTISERLADDFQRLCLHAGWSCNKKYASKKWRLRFSKNNEPIMKRSQWIPYEGKVYCCTVPEGDGILYVRRKGIPCWSGNSRANNGPIVSLTRQPSEGRARDGGLRLGEMECECLWSYGIIQFLKERLMECSDNYRIFTCKQCGMMAVVNPEKGLYFCKNCKNNTNFAQHRIPYAAKLLLQEIQAMNVSTRFIT